MEKVETETQRKIPLNLPQEYPNNEYPQLIRRQTRELLRALVNERMGSENTSQMPLPPDLYKTICDWFSRVTDNVEKHTRIIQHLQIDTQDRCHQVCREIISETFEDNKVSLGRVLAYFGFTYHLCEKFPRDKERILRVTGELLDEFVLPWVAEHGGWESIVRSGKIGQMDFNRTKLACYIAACAIGMYLIFKSVSAAGL